MKKIDYTILLSILFIGLGYIFIIPPFEPFDESAHYSRFIDQASNNFSIKNKTVQFDKRIEEYNGPLPYKSGSPPFDQHLTYHKFFSQNDNSDYLKEYRENNFSLEFIEGTIERNDQYQHPPFYSIFMGSFLKAMENKSMHSQLVSLRAISFLISIIAIAIVLITFNKFFPDLKKQNFLIYFILFPMFFIEFARIGTDSMCLLICSIIFYFLSQSKEGYSAFNLKTIGFICGIGMLFKSFFIAIFFALIVYFLYLSWLKTRSCKQSILAILNFIFPFLLISIPWLYANQIINSDFSLGFEFNDLFKMHPNDIYQNISVKGILRGFLVPVITATWSGTWSLTRVPIIMQIIFLLPLIFYATLFFVKKNKKQNIGSPIYYSCILIVVMFYIALCAHVIISQLAIGLGTSPGWYLHILAPWIILLIAGINQEYLKNKLVNKVKSILLIIMSCNIFITLWLHLCLYAGFAIKNNNKYFEFTESINQIFYFQEIIERTSVLNYVPMGLFLIVIGYLMVFFIYIRQNKV